MRDSLVLLKNENHLLPLSKQTKHLVVVGKGADDLGMQCGGWTIDWQGGHGNVTHGGTTLLAAIKQTVSPETEVVYSPDAGGITNADAIVAVVGEPPYAEMKGDRKHLDLSAGRLCLDRQSESQRHARRDDFILRPTASAWHGAGRQPRLCRRLAAGH